MCFSIMEIHFEYFISSFDSALFGLDFVFLIFSTLFFIIGAAAADELIVVVICCAPLSFNGKSTDGILHS